METVRMEMSFQVYVYANQTLFNLQTRFEEEALGYLKMAWLLGT